MRCGISERTVSTAIQAVKYSLPTQEKLGREFCAKIDEAFEIYKEAESGASMETREKPKKD